ANQLKLQETKDEELSVASFSNKIPKKCYSKKAEIGVKIGTEKVITCEVNVMQVVEINDKNISSIIERKELDGIKSYWKQLEILIGIKDFFKFIKLDKAQELESGFVLLQTKLGPILAGNGYMNNIHNANAISVETVVTCAASQASHNDIDQF
ncbi:unnamed protein product, partial [Onchocerca ochengi]